MHDDGVIALITNRNFIEKAAFDGFRKDVESEFQEIYVVDLGGDVRANPKLSGTKHNVFGIQTGVTISFLVKRHKQKGCKIFYARRPEFDSAEDKLAFLTSSKLSGMKFERIEPDKKGNWVDLTDNDWDDFIPLVSKAAKSNKTGAKSQAIFRLFSRGLGTFRDEWVYDEDADILAKKMRHFISVYEDVLQSLDHSDRDTIKWDRELEKHLKSRVTKTFEDQSIRAVQFRPFTKRWVYFDRHLNGMTYQLPSLFKVGENNPTITILGIASANPLAVFSCDTLFDLGQLKNGNGGTQGVPLYRYTSSGERVDNITDWGLKQFQTHYGKAEKICKEDIFHYVYAVLHDPFYREKYAMNLKREFPRIPFYPGFGKWANWGKRLMELHIGYETVEPWPLKRIDAPDEKARAASVSPKVVLKADKETCVIRLDVETQLSGIPVEAWTYRLGNRSGLEWVLDQYREKTPKDSTIREKFNTYRFADYKEKVIDLLMRVTRVSVETMEIVEAMRSAHRRGSADENCDGLSEALDGP